MPTNRGASSTHPRAVLVSGASGGIGRDLIERLAKGGFIVYASARDENNLAAAVPQSLYSGRIIPLSLDVTDEASIAHAAERIAEDTGTRGLAGLVNMAGIIVEGPLDLIPVDAFRQQFEVNVVGPFALTRAVLPLLQRGRGRIVNIGAASAHTTVPFFGAVSASKAALASINDAMRMEFSPLGVDVVLIEPGAIETGILRTSEAFQEAAFKHQPPAKVAFYRPAIEAMRTAMRKSAIDKPGVVTTAVVKALTDPRPKPRVLVGKGSGQLAFLRRLPTRMRDRVLMSSLGIAKELELAATAKGKSAEPELHLNAKQN